MIKVGTGESGAMSDDEPLVSPPADAEAMSLLPRSQQQPAQLLAADEYSPVGEAISASNPTSVAVSKLKEHALASVRRADQLRHELVQRSSTELAQAQARSSRMEEIVEHMVATQNSYLQHLQHSNDGGGDTAESPIAEVAALAELHESSERCIAEMREVFAASDSPTAQHGSNESRWQSHQERVRKDTLHRRRLAAKKAPLPKRSRQAEPKLLDSDELQKAEALAEQRGKEVEKLKKALEQSHAEVARLTTELEATLEADVSKLEQVHKRVGEQRKVDSDTRLMKQLQTAQAMLEAEQLLHSATQREAKEAQEHINRLRSGLPSADVEGNITNGGGENRSATEAMNGRQGSATVSKTDTNMHQLRSELEMANGRARLAAEQVSSLEAQVNKLELELELAHIKLDGQEVEANSTSIMQAATAHGSRMARKEQSRMETTHLRKAIANLEAEKAAQEQSHAREMADMSKRLAAARAEVASYQRRLESETASVETTREELMCELAAEKQRHETAQTTADAQRQTIQMMRAELRGLRLQVFACACTSQLRKGAWLTKYAHTTFKIKRIFAHVQDGRLYWGKKRADTGSCIELARVRSITFGHTASQVKHIEHNLTRALNNQRPVHVPWHCVTVHMSDGKEVSLAGPLNDQEAGAGSTGALLAAGGPAVAESGEGCQDMIVWYAGLSAFAAQRSTGSGEIVTLPSLGSILWKRCAMRIERMAQDRNMCVFEHAHADHHI